MMGTKRRSPPRGEPDPLADRDADPAANFAESIDEQYEIAAADHVALDGTPHVTADDVEQLGADLWVRDRAAEIDEAGGPQDELRGAA